MLCSQFVAIFPKCMVNHIPLPAILQVCVTSRRVQITPSNKSVKMNTIKYLLIIILSFGPGCASNVTSEFMCRPEKPCYERGMQIWQKAIDEISAANFPEHKFQGRIWTYPFKNAWATPRGTVNITEDLLNDLNETKRLSLDPKVTAIAAHEIAHIKLGHYNSNDWVKIQKLLANLHDRGFPNPNQVDAIKIKELTKLNEKLNLAADKLAITYLLKAGYNPDDYLNLLNWVQDNMANTEQIGTYIIPSSIKNRIKGILAFKNEKTTYLPN